MGIWVNKGGGDKTEQGLKSKQDHSGSEGEDWYREVQRQRRSDIIDQTGDDETKRYLNIRTIAGQRARSAAQQGHAREETEGSGGCGGQNVTF